MRLGRLVWITASIASSTTAASAALFSNSKRSFHSSLTTMSSLFEFTVKDAQVCGVAWVDGPNV